MLFLTIFSIIIQLWIKRIQDGSHLWCHLCNYGCHGSHLDTTRLHLIESSKEAHYLCKILCQSNELHVKSSGEGYDWHPPPHKCLCNFFLFKVFMVKSKRKAHCPWLATKNFYLSLSQTWQTVIYDLNTSLFNSKRLENKPRRAVLLVYTACNHNPFPKGNKLTAIVFLLFVALNIN